MNRQQLDGFGNLFIESKGRWLMSIEQAKESLAKNVNSLCYLQSVLLNMASEIIEIQNASTLMLRLADKRPNNIPSDIIVERYNYELAGIAQMAEKLRECLEITANLTNNRDMADESSIKRFEESVKRLKALEGLIGK
jgi:hypothetical protein